MKIILFTFSMLTAYLASAQTEENLPPTEERKTQLEFSGGYYGRRYNSTYLLGFGINKPGKREGWYTNYSLHLSHYGPFSKYGTDYHTISIGKHYQWQKGDFYASLGMNVGALATYSGRDNYSAGYGLALMPRMEIGVNANKVILAVGAHTSVGYGYFVAPSNPELYNNNFGLAGTFSPYVKIILK